MFWRQSGAFFLHVLLQVVLEIFEHQIQLVLAEENLFESIASHNDYLLDNVGVLQVLEETYFADGC